MVSTTVVAICATLLFILGALVSLAWNHRRLLKELETERMERRRLFDQLLIARGVEPISDEAKRAETQRNDERYDSMRNFFASSGEMLMSEVGGEDDER